VGTDVYALSSEIRQLEEEYELMDRQLQKVQREEEEHEQASYREMLELSFMREDSMGDILLLQSVDIQYDLLFKIKRERSNLLDALHDERQRCRNEKDLRIGELKDKKRKDGQSDDD
jgi:hypothetical protein